MHNLDLGAGRDGEASRGVPELVRVQVGYADRPAGYSQVVAIHARPVGIAERCVRLAAVDLNFALNRAARETHAAGLASPAIAEVRTMGSCA